MKKLLFFITVVMLFLASFSMLFSCTLNNQQNDKSENEHQCEIPELTEGENGNWWLGDEDTGIPVSTDRLEITDTESEFVTIDGVDYCKVTITFSDGTKKEVMSKLPSNPSEDEKDDDGETQSFVTTASITNGYGGTNGIVCLMTDNDNGKFETMALLDELYIKYGLVGGWGTVVKNLYTDTSYTVPKLGVVAKVQEFLDTGRWKIINHSMTHTTYCDVVDGVKVVNEDKLHSELVTSIDHLRTLFPNERVLTYAMTGTESALGQSSDPNNLRAREREVIGENYIGGRFKYTGATAFNELKWNNLPHKLLSRANLDGILKDIDAAAKEGKYFMVYNHYVIEDELFDTVNESSWTNKTTAEALCERVSQYVKDGSLWNAHFEDAVMYMREKETATVTASFDSGIITVILTDEMDDAIYNHPLTVKLTVPENWDSVKITQNGVVSYAEVKEADGVYYVLSNITPDKGEATLEYIAIENVPAEIKPEPKPTPDITITNPVVPNSDIPDVYTFDTLDGYLGKQISFNNSGVDTNKISIATEGENNVLKMEKIEEGGNPTVTILGKTLTGATYFVAETKIKINQNSTSGETYVNLVDSQGNYAYRAFIKVNSDNTLVLTDFRSGSSLRATSQSFCPEDGYVTLKIVYTVANGAASITVYANGTEVLTSSNHYSAKSTPMEADKISAVQFNFAVKYLGELYLDDVVVKAIN